MSTTASSSPPRLGADTSSSQPAPPSVALPDFIGMTLLPKPPRPTPDSAKLYKELWNKVAWAMGSSFNCPYRGSTEIRSLARRLVLVIVANEGLILPKS